MWQENVRSCQRSAQCHSGSLKEVMKYKKGRRKHVVTME